MYCHYVCMYVWLAALQRDRHRPSETFIPWPCVFVQGEQNTRTQLVFENLVFRKAENIFFIYFCDIFQFAQSVGGGNEIKVKDQLYFYYEMLIIPAAVP